MSIRRKKYWFYHENSDSILQMTHDQWEKSGSEVGFLHEIGPVITGQLSEGETLLERHREKYADRKS